MSTLPVTGLPSFRFQMTCPPHPENLFCRHTSRKDLCLRFWNFENLGRGTTLTACNKRASFSFCPRYWFAIERIRSFCASPLGASLDNLVLAFFYNKLNNRPSPFQVPLSSILSLANSTRYLSVSEWPLFCFSLVWHKGRPGFARFLLQRHSILLWRRHWPARKANEIESCFETCRVQRFQRRSWTF